MLPSSSNRLTRYGLILFFVLVIGYGVFEARGLLIGPTIVVSDEVTETNAQMVKIEGHADRITSLTMNGTDIPVTEQGDFSEPFVLAAGMNEITLQAKDKYGKETVKIVRIVYSPAARATAPTSTP